MRFGSVCSGIEAASVAFNPLGWEAAWLAEIEPFPCSVLVHHYPEVPNLGDMTTIEARVRAREIEAPDMLCGGTPCQSFSVAGLRKSLDDERGNLALEFIRIANAIDDIRRHSGRPPAYILWENVPGILSTKDNAFGAFLGGLSGRESAIDQPVGGWTYAGVVAGPQRVVAWRTLDAQFFGLAQRRKRVFVLALGGAGGWRCADALLPISNSLQGHPAPRRETGQRTAARAALSVALRGREGGATAELGDDVGFGLRASGGGGDKPHVMTTELLCVATGQAGADMGADMAPTLNCNHEAPYIAKTLLGGGHSNNPLDENLIAHSLRGEGFDASEDGTGRGTPLVPVACDVYNGTVSDDVAATMGANSGQSANHAGPSVMVPVSIQGNMINRADHAGPAGRGISEDGISFTLTKTDVHAVCFDTTQVTSKANRSNPKYGDPCHPLADGAHAPAIAFNHQAGGTQTILGYDPASGLAPCLNKSQTPAISGLQVRRLTPKECARLQGFPDDYLDILHRGKPAADGNKYKALGNSWAVPNVRWIGRRIEMVEAIATEAREAA